MTSSRIGLACVACLALAGPVLGQATPPAPPTLGTFATSAAVAPVPPSAEALAAVTERGRALADYDRWLGFATDAALDAGLTAEAASVVVGLKEGDRWHFCFGALDEAAGLLRVAAEATGGGPERQVQAQLVSPAREEKGAFLTAAKACRTAVAAAGPRDRGYAVAPLPDGTGGYWVYVYPVQFKPDALPLGGDFRIRVGADGTSVLDVRRMHMAILAQRLPDPKEFPPDSEIMMYQTALLREGVEDTDVMAAVLRPIASKSLVIGRVFSFEIARDGTIRGLGTTDAYLDEVAKKSKDKRWIEDLRARVKRGGGPAKKEGAP